MNIYDARIQSQTEKAVTVAFTLSNREGVQPNISYGAQLVRLSGSDPSYVAATFPAEEKAVLKNNENQAKTLSFVIPEYLPEGQYQVELWASNSAGITLAFATAGIVSVSSGGEGIVLEGDSCFLSISQGDPDQRYALDDGVDIASNEDLILTCQALNSGTTAQELSPRFTTYRRNTGSGIQVVTNEVSGETLRLAPGEKKAYAVRLPKASLPQAYDVALALYTQAGHQVSNELTVHYVVRGASGTLQNILLDKEMYRAGEIAQATITFSGSADAFPEARGNAEGTAIQEMTIEAFIRDEQGQMCSERSIQKVDGSSIQHVLLIPITSSCQQPVVSARLINSDDDTLLDEVSASLVSKDSMSPVAMAQNTKESGMSKGESAGIVAIVVVLVGLLIVLGAKFFRSRGRGGMMGVLVLALVVGGMWNIGTARADTINAGLDKTWRIWLTYTLDKSVYNVGDTMTASAWGSYLTCSNKYRAGLAVYVKPNSADVYAGANQRPDHIAQDAVGLATRQSWRSAWEHAWRIPKAEARAVILRYSRTKSFTVLNSWNSSSPTASFRFNHWITHKGRPLWSGTYYREIPYTLATNGVCGSANGVAVSTSPDSGLCSAGTPTIVSGADPYTWSCIGSGGMTTASCSAPHVVPSTLKICENSCNSGLDRTGQTFLVDQGVIRTLKACYNTAASCTNESGDVTASAIWTDSNAPQNVISFPSKGMLQSNTTAGSESFSIVFLGNTKTATAQVACVPLACISAKSVTDTYCPEESRDTGVSNGCGLTLHCSGTRFCDTNYREVTP